jgi:hypothetical protein
MHPVRRSRQSKRKFKKRCVMNFGGRCVIKHWYAKSNFFLYKRARSFVFVAIPRLQPAGRTRSRRATPRRVRLEIPKPSCLSSTPVVSTKGPVCGISCRSRGGLRRREKRRWIFLHRFVFRTPRRAPPPRYYVTSPYQSTRTFAVRACAPRFRGRTLNDSAWQFPKFASRQPWRPPPAPPRRVVCFF